MIDNRSHGALTAVLGTTSLDPRRPEPLLPTKERFYRAELDVVRFLAFVLVFFRHFLPCSFDPATTSHLHGLARFENTTVLACGYGVDLFFTLSAYLICELLLRERDAADSVSVKKFYIRRILRIWPLYFASLAVAFVFALKLADRATVDWVEWSAFLLGNWFVVFHGIPGTPFAPLWSISVEEQFYLFVPWAIKYLSRRILVRLACLLLIIANLCLLLIGLAIRYNSFVQFQFSIWYNSFVQFQFFATGILLSVMLRGRLPRIALWKRLALAAACAFCFYFSSSLALTPRQVGNANPESWSLIVGFGLTALGCCLLLLAFMGMDAQLLPRWATYLGRISYGLYVFHVFVIFVVNAYFSKVTSISGAANYFLRGSVAFGFTVLIASVSYRYFEAPFLRLKKRHQTIESRPV